MLNRTVRPGVGVLSRATQRRFLNVHECDAYSILNKHGIKTPRGLVAYTAQEARQRAIELGGGQTIVKAQVLAGGRGLGKFASGYQGGVHIAKTPDAAADIASKMIGDRLITKQTGAEGRPVHKVMVAETIEIAKEMYLALVLDRKSGGFAIIGSAEGGTAIEETAKNNPNAIAKEPIKILEGISPAACRRVAIKLGLEGDLIEQAVDQLQKLYECMLKTDATQIEVNPLVVTKDGRLLCADAKLNFDDNADFRQESIFDLRDTTQENSRDVEAQSHGLSYVGLDGNIGCLVNGAGLAMATMDILKLYNGDPANFLDVGGSADEKTITEAFKIITSDPKVDCIFVNIFGGIMSCKTIARGVMAALKTVEVKVPIVVRLQGTANEEGGTILAAFEGTTPLVAIRDLDNAAKCAVEFAKLTGEEKAKAKSSK